MQSLGPSTKATPHARSRQERAELYGRLSLPAVPWQGNAAPLGLPWLMREGGHWYCEEAEHALLIRGRTYRGGVAYTGIRRAAEALAIL